jgi:hypothetical protein
MNFFFISGEQPADAEARRTAARKTAMVRSDRVMVSF